MPYVFRTMNKKTGKEHPMWRYEIRDYLGRKRRGTGSTDKRETLRIALQVQAKQNAIKSGASPIPKASDQIHEIDTLITEYINWGESQGGRRGRPWAPEHAKKRKAHLAWWKAELGIETQIDLIGCQIKVERLIQRMTVKEGLAGKTVTNVVEALHAFCGWCSDRSYLDDNPLRRLGTIDTTPRQRRRAMTPEEICSLLEHCPASRRLLYETALCTGLRANELRHITPAHLNAFRGGIRLDAEWTKNRREGFQPTPRWLMLELNAAAADKDPNSQLLDIAGLHHGRLFDTDLKNAGILKHKPGEGKLDFHALRTTFITMLDSHGGSAKECMDLARHATPVLTMNTYVRASDGHKRSVVDALGEVVRLPTSPQQSPNGSEAENKGIQNVI